MLESLDAVVSEWWRSATRWTISHAVPSSYSSDLTYLRFHFLFTLPLAALLGLALLVKSRLRHDPVRWFGLFLIGLVAFLTATPWDAYLVYRGVWSYLPNKVLWTAYGVPAEEYAFFVLQPIITGLLFFLIEPVHVTQPSPQRRLPLSQGARRLVRIAAGLATLAVAAYFAFAVDDSRWLYQRLIVSYFFPFIAIQLLWGADQILENLFVNGSVVIALVVSTLYFWFADSIAIALGSWKISDTHTCGLKLFGMLPLEEATFFFVTNVLIVQGLFLWEMLFAPRAPLKDTPEKKKLRSKKKVVIIGAGLAGLAASGRLARAGYQVEVIEKNSHEGGRCDYISRDGHRFDTGPSILLMPELFDEAYKALGEDFHKVLDLRRCDPIYNIYFDDNQLLATTNDLGEMKLRLEQIERGSFCSFLRYMEEGHHHFYQSIWHVVGRNFRTIFEFLDPRKVAMLISLRPLQSHYNYISRFFRNKNLRSAFSFQNMYLGLSPYDAPATYSLLQYTEYADGVWYPLGGMFKIAESLRAIAEKNGVRFRFDTEVSGIKTTSGKVTKVQVNKGKEEIAADVVVCNADLPWAYQELLPNKSEAKKVNNLRFTSSALMFYWAVDKIYPQIGHHNVFLNGDYKKSFDSIFVDHAVPDEPSFYVNAPQRTDPSAAPKGEDSLMVLVPVGYLDEKNATKEFWAKKTKEVREYVFNRLARVGITDLREHIKWEVTRDPIEWRDMYNLARGNIFGLSHDFWQVAYFRPANKHSAFSNFYFTGASTHPGSGMPLVLLSAKLTTERILEDEEDGKQ